MLSIEVATGLLQRDLNMETWQVTFGDKEACSFSSKHLELPRALELEPLDTSLLKIRNALVEASKGPPPDLPWKATCALCAMQFTRTKKPKAVHTCAKCNVQLNFEQTI